MVHFLRKTGLFIARSVLALVALLFVGLIALQILLLVGINLLSAGLGTDFFADRANRALAQSGYQVAFTALYYDPVRGVSIRDLSVSDTEGEFLTLDTLSIDPSFSRSAMRTLALDAQGGNLVLSRMPVSNAEPAPDATDGMQPFTVPDLFFRTLILSDLAFENVTLGPTIAGAPYSFAPTLEARATLDDVIAATLTLVPGLPELAPGLPAPETINLSAHINPATLDVALDTLDVKAASYALSAKGTGNLADKGHIALSIEAQHSDLSPLTQDAILNAQAQATIEGPLNGPALDLAATIVPGTLKERGLSDISITVQTANVTQGMQGHAHIETTFREQPVTLDAALSYEAPTLRISDLTGSAPSLTLQGGGTLATDTSLFDGTLTITARDLAPYGDLAGIKLSGAADAALTFSPSDTGAQSASVDATLTHAAYEEITVKKLSLQAMMESLTTPWPQSAKVQATALRINEDVTLDSLSAAITAAGDAQYKLTTTGKGRAPMPLSFDGSAALSNLTEYVPTARDIGFTITQGKSSIRINGDFAPDALNLTLDAPDIRGRDLPANVPDALNDVRFALTGAMTGTPSQPLTEATLKISNLGAGDYQNASANVSAKHDGQNVTAQLNGQGTGIRNLAADAAFPMTLSLLPFQFSFEKTAPLSGTLDANIDMAAIAPIFLPPSQSLSGALVAHGTITGTVSDPAPTARLRIQDANFDDGQNGITLAQINLDASLSRDSISLTSLSATDGKDGKMTGRGAMSFADGAADITLRIQDFNIPKTDLANGIVNADLSLRGAAEGMNLSGKAIINEMNVLIPETFQSRIPQLNIVDDEKTAGPSFLEKLALDITIEADNRIFVRGWGLDAEFGGTIAVTGAASAPQFNGTMESRRGRFEEFGKRFTLARANLRFQGSIPPSPYLDIEATTPAGDVTGSILFTGPVTSPSIKFSSTPALPDDEVLSRILFGKEAAKISPFQAVQLARTIARFSGQGGGSDFDPLGMLRSATGLDDISVDTDETGATNVDVGKYLTDNVYLELSKGKGEDSGAATIQIEVTPSINIESRVGQDAQGGGGVFWKRDY